MIKYPTGINKKITKEDVNKINKSNANRGMNFEYEINITNQYYLENNIALIYKKPTPIKIVKVNYKNKTQITEAYFKQQSTTDYVGIYKSLYIDFEAKTTRKSTSFPLSNIPAHQIQHLSRVIEHGGISFFLINFVILNEIYFIKTEHIISFYKGTKKSIPIKFIRENGYLIKEKYFPRIDYLEILRKILNYS